MQVKRPMKEKGSAEVKKPIEVNFKRGGGQKNFSLSPHSRTYPLHSHFGTMAPPLNVVTLVLHQIRLAIIYTFRVEKGRKERSGEGIEAGVR